MANVLRSPFYAPKPSDDFIWGGPTRDSAIIALLTQQKVFGAGGQVPTPRWQPYYNYDVGEASVWYPTPENLNSAVLPMLTQQKFFGAGGQVPTKRWQPYYNYDDSSGWQFGPKASTLLIPQLSSGPIKFQREWLFGYDDFAGWQYLETVPLRNLSIVTITASPIVVNVPPWRFTYDDPPFWVGTPLNADAISLLTQQKIFGVGGQGPTTRWSPYYNYDTAETFWIQKPVASSVLPSFTVGGQPPTKRWNIVYNYDVGETFWQGSPTGSVNTHGLVGPSAFIPPPWKFSYIDDFNVWYAQPTNARTLLLPQVTPFIYPPWKFSYADDFNVWNAAPTVARTVTLPQVFAFIPPPWKFSYADDFNVWNAKPTASTILAPILTAAGQVHNKQWLFGYDDPPFWQPILGRQMQLLVAPPLVPNIIPIPWRWNSDDPPHWFRSYIPSNIFNLPIPLILDFRYIVSPNAALPSNSGAARVFTTSPKVPFRAF